MQTIPTTKERGLLPFKTRIGEASIPKRFIFVNEDGSPRSIADEDFELLCLQQPGATRNLIRLTVDDGLTIEGAGNNELVFELTAEQSEQKPNVYFGLLRSQDSDNTWFNWSWEFFNGVYEGVGECSETEVTLCVNGENILVTILDCAVTQAELDAALALKADLNTRSISTTSTATLTPNIDSYDLFVISAQAEALTIANPTGTPINGNAFVIRIKDNGTARAISYGNQYRAVGVSLPTTTVISKLIYLAMIWNSVDSKWDVVGVNQEI